MANTFSIIKLSVSPCALAAAVNFALGVSSAKAGVNYVYSPGVSVISTSSFESQQALLSLGLSFPFAYQQIMAADLLTANKTPWVSDGDTRYTFGANDPNATIEINLGTLHEVNEIGAVLCAPSCGDRPVYGPISIFVSTNGTTWSQFGSTLNIDSSYANSSNTFYSPYGAPATTVTIAGVLESVQYIEYEFGPSGAYDGSYGGAAVNSVFADRSAASAVPEPSTWAMGLIGFFGLGIVGYRRNSGERVRLAA